MTNREYFLNTNMYDILCKMNETLMKQPDNTTEMCIMCCFMSSSDAGARCYVDESGSGNYSCDKCIADYMNEFQF